MSYKAIAIGASAGGVEAIRKILSALPSDFPLPILIAQHLQAQKNSHTEDYFRKYCRICIKEAESNMEIKGGTVYFAPPDYHLLAEKNGTLSLSTEGKVNYSRPSIDVLFETAADAYESKLAGIILTGASNDGSRGLAEIKRRGGLCIVQDPKTAFMETMPASALKLINADYVLSLEEIVDLLVKLPKL